MKHSNETLVQLMNSINFGSPVAEMDNLLETARVETSVFSDLLRDHVDLIPGNKGSGKSALYRMFVEFLNPLLLERNKVVIAHGVSRHGDTVFLAFNERFEKLDEDDFVNFWCIYFVSLIHEQFIKSPKYGKQLKKCKKEVGAFRLACQNAYIPEIKIQKSLIDILEWTLSALGRISPKLRYNLPDDLGNVELDLFGGEFSQNKTNDQNMASELPQYAARIKQTIEDIMVKINLSLWLMVDKLDEIFPRRSDLERRALRGLLRTIRIFGSERIRIKVFLRDDILDEVAKGGKGFTALSHVTARQADTLRWSEDQILIMIINRLFASERLRNYLDINPERLEASLEYKREAFKRVFSPTVHQGSKQSSTLRWIYTHTADGNNVVTPRDVIELLTRAKQFQHSRLKSDPSGQSEWIIGPQAILYGLQELSKRKKNTFLEAEFPHLWPYISKFSGGKSDYSGKTIRTLLGKNTNEVINDLKSIGFLSEKKSKEEVVYAIPFVFRKGLNITQGRA